jgi:hypothetical protein
LEIAPKVREVAAVYRSLWPEQPNPNAILNVAILTGAQRPRRVFDYDQNGTDEKQVEVLEAESPHEPIAAKTEEKREVTWESRDTAPALNPVPQPTPVEIAAQVRRQKEAEYREKCRHWRLHT